MKVTDYAPRAAGLDSHLRGRNLYGIEVGCDVGAHAEALLRYCSIDKLILVDIWDNDFYRGYCMGRLQTQGWKNHVDFMQLPSHEASLNFEDGVFDFIYIDIVHDTLSVSQALLDWWPKLKSNGVLGYRNYTAKTIRPALDEFVNDFAIDHVIESYHNEIILFKGKRP